MAASTRSRSASPPSNNRSIERLGRYAPLLLALAVLAVYLPASGNGFIYDDSQVILIQQAPRSLAEVAQIFAERHFYNLPYYRPITRATLLLQKSLHGPDPVPFHVFNAVLAALAALLAWRLVAVCGGPRPLLAGALFALHPIASSCVYPVSSGRETLLPTTLTLAAVLMWIRGRKVLAWVLFVAALLSKEQSVVVPALFVLADVTGMSRQRPDWKSYWPLAPIVAGYALIRYVLFGGTEYAAGSLVGPLLSLAYAVQTISVPFLSLHYEPPLSAWVSPIRGLVAAGALAAVVFLIRRQGAPALRFWLGWFVIALLPTANLLRQEAAYDERYVLLASIAAFAVVTAVVPWRVVVAVAVMCASVSMYRARYFADDLAFSRQWIVTDPTNVNGHFNLGYGLARSGRVAEAVAPYREAVRLKPNSALARNNLGDALMKTDHPQEAEPHLREAARLDPSLAVAHYNLGSILAGRSEFEAAAKEFAEAIRTNPAFPEAHLNLGNVNAARGDLDGAIRDFEQALALQPNYTDARRNLELARSLRAQKQGR